MLKSVAAAAFLTVAAFGFSPIPALATLPDNTWMAVDSNGPLLEGRTAYSGGAYDRTHHQFLLFGGGHNDGWHNDVLAFDISTLTWKSMYATDSSNDHVCGNVSSATPGMLLASQLPASRHSYDQLDCIDHLGKMVLWSGPTYSGAGLWSCAGQTLPADTWLYDWAANKWEYKNTARQAQPAGESCSGAYDPVGKLYYAVDRDNYYYPRFWSYNAETDIWTKLAVFSDSASGVTTPSLGAVASMDTKRQRFWSWPAYYDIPTGKWGKAATGGAPSSVHRFSEAGAPFIALYYDEANDALVTFGNGGSTVYIYHPGNGQWETLSPANPPSVSGYLYGRFFYDPVDQVFLMIQNTGNRPKTWAYRYKKAAGTKTEALAEAQDALTISPNPVHGAAVVRLSGIESTELRFSAAIYNTRGQKVLALPPNRQAWSVAGLPAGVYLVRVSAGSAVHSKRFIVQR